MPKSVSVRLLDGKHRSVNLDDCDRLVIANDSIASLGLSFLASRLAESHGRPRPTPDEGAKLAEHNRERFLSPPLQFRELIPRGIFRDLDGLPFAEATTSFGLAPKNLDPPVFLEIPRTAMAEFLELDGFDSVTKSKWTDLPESTSVAKNGKRAKAPRDGRLTALCLEYIKEAFRKWEKPPSPTELKRRVGCCYRPPADAYARFYESAEYKTSIEKGRKPWGPGPPRQEEARYRLRSLPTELISSRSACFAGIHVESFRNLRSLA